MTDIKRLNYFNSQFLVDKDFNDEQAYHLGMRRRHNRALHTWGVADGGLLVTKKVDKAVSISSGTAIDEDGQEIVLLDPQTVDLSTFAANVDVYVSIQYRDVQDQLDRYTSGGVDNYTRWTERPLVQVTTTLPPTDGSVIPLAKVHLDGSGNVGPIDTSVCRLAGSLIAPTADVTLASLKVTGDLDVKGTFTGKLGAPIKHSTLTKDDGRNPHGLTLGDIGALPAVGGTISGDLRVTGNVGIGTTDPKAKLQVNGGAIMPAAGNTDNAGIMFPRDPGGGSGDAAWLRYYARAGEDMTLELGVANDSTDHIALMASGNVGIRTAAPQAPLHVADYMAVGPFAIAAGQGGIEVTGAGAEFGFARRDLTAWPSNPAAGDRFVWYNAGGTARLFTDSVGDLVLIDSSGQLKLTRGSLTVEAGDLKLPMAGTGYAQFTGRSFANDPSPAPSNLSLLKLSLGFQSSLALPGQTSGLPPVYEFAIGHIWGSIVGQQTFQKKFSVNSQGDMYCAGSKSGFVADYFVNRAGDALEQGDIVVIADSQDMLYTGTNNSIPLLEVDLTDRAYDERVCGIVANAITDQELPFVEMDFQSTSLPAVETEVPTLRKTKGRKEETRGEELPHSEPYVHPLRGFAAQTVPDMARTVVQSQQMGRMVTLGAYAHCKVDADIAPIQVGDLLTTSPTSGHAQKVLDPGKAVGAILGKALASLDKGKGKIPVLVTLQ